MTTIAKLDVAVHQLNVAIRGDYLAALTLAGAAEEILGRLCERGGKPVAVEFIVDYHLKDSDPALPEKERRKILRGVLNSGRNAAKDANDPNETSFDVEHVFPLQMLMRAIPMSLSRGEAFGRNQKDGPPGSRPPRSVAVMHVLSRLGPYRFG